MMKKQNNPLTLYVLFLILALIWSTSFIAIKFSIESFSASFAPMLRVAVALFTLSILCLCLKTPLRLPFRTARLLWLQGVIAQGIAFLFLFWGEQYLSPALAAIINSMVPLWVLIINGLVLREKGTFTFKKTLGLILGFIGIIFLFGPMVSNDMEAHNHSAWMTILGALSVTGMAIAYASGAVLYQKLLGKATINFQASIWHQSLGSFVFLFLFLLCTNSWPGYDQFFHHSSTALWAIVYLGILATALGWIIYSHLIVQWGAVRAVSVLYVVPLFAVVWDMLFLHLSIRFHELLGMIIILLGVIFVQMPSQKK